MKFKEVNGVTVPRFEDGGLPVLQDNGRGGRGNSFVSNEDIHSWRHGPLYSPGGGYGNFSPLEEADQGNALLGADFTANQMGHENDPLNLLRVKYAAKQNYGGAGSVFSQDGVFHRAGNEQNGWNTQLLPEEDSKYKAWIRSNHLEKYESKYDMAAFWKEAVASDLKWGSAEFEKMKEHFEKPSSPTFTSNSYYADEQNMAKGHWMTTKSGKTHFVNEDVYSHFAETQGVQDREVDDKMMDKILNLNEATLRMDKYAQQKDPGDNTPSLGEAKFRKNIKELAPENFTELMDIYHRHEFRVKTKEQYDKAFPHGRDSNEAWAKGQTSRWGVESGAALRVAGIYGGAYEWDPERLKAGENPIVDVLSKEKIAGMGGKEVKTKDAAKKISHHVIDDFFSSMFGQSQPATPFSSFGVHNAGEQSLVGVALTKFAKPTLEFGKWIVDTVGSLVNDIHEGSGDGLRNFATQLEAQIDNEAGQDEMYHQGKHFYNDMHTLVGDVFGLLGEGMKLGLIAEISSPILATAMPFLEAAGIGGEAIGASLDAMEIGKFGEATAETAGLRTPEMVEKGKDLLRWGLGKLAPKKAIAGLAKSVLGASGIFALQDVTEKQEEIEVAKRAKEDQEIGQYLGNLLSSGSLSEEEMHRIDVNANMSNAEERAAMAMTGLITLASWEVAPKVLKGMGSNKYFRTVVEKTYKSFGANTTQTMLADLYNKLLVSDGNMAKFGRGAIHAMSGAVLPGMESGTHMGIAQTTQQALRGAIDNYTYDETYQWKKLPEAFKSGFFTGVAFHVPHMQGAWRNVEERSISFRNYGWFKKSYDEGLAHIQEDIKSADNTTDPNMRVFERTMDLCDYVHKNKITDQEFKTAYELATGGKIAAPFKNTARGAINLLDLINESGFTGESWTWEQRQRIVDVAMNLKWISGLRELKGYDKKTDLEIFDPVIGMYNDMKRWQVDHSMHWEDVKDECTKRIGVEKTYDIVNRTVANNLSADEREMVLNEAMQKVIFAHDGMAEINKRVDALEEKLANILLEQPAHNKSAIYDIANLTKTASRGYDAVRYKRHPETGSFVYNNKGEREVEFNPKSHEQYILENVKKYGIDVKDPAHRAAYEIQTALSYLLDLRERSFQKGLDIATSEKGVDEICNKVKKDADEIRKVKNNVEADKTAAGQGEEKIEEDKTAIEDKAQEHSSIENAMEIDEEMEAVEEIRDEDRTAELHETQEQAKSSLTERQKEMARIRRQQKQQRAEEDQQRWQQEEEQNAAMAEQGGEMGEMGEEGGEGMEEPPSRLEQAEMALQESGGDKQAVDEFAEAAKDDLRKKQFMEKEAAGQPDGIPDGMSLGNHSELIGDISWPQCNTAKEYDDLCRHLSGGFNRLNEAMQRDNGEPVEGMPIQGTYRDPNTGIDYQVKRNDDGTFSLRFMDEDEIPFDTYKDMMEATSKKIKGLMDSRNIRPQLEKLKETTPEQDEPIRGTGKKPFMEKKSGRSAGESIKPDEGYKPTKESWTVGATPKERSAEGAGWKKVNNPSIPNEDFNMTADGSPPSIKFNHKSEDYKNVFLSRMFTTDDEMQKQRVLEGYENRMKTYAGVVDTLLGIKDKKLRADALEEIIKTDRRTWEEVVRTIPLVHSCKAGKMFLDTAYKSDYASPSETDHQLRVFDQRERLIKHMIMEDGKATGYTTERVFRGIKKIEGGAEALQDLDMANSDDKRQAKSFADNKLFEGAKLSIEQTRSKTGGKVNTLMLNTQEGGKFALSRRLLAGKHGNINPDFLRGLSSLIHDVIVDNEMIIDSKTGKEYGINLSDGAAMRGMDVVNMFIEKGQLGKLGYLEIGDGEWKCNSNPRMQVAEDGSDKSKICNSLQQYQFRAKLIPLSESNLERTIPVDFSFGELNFEKGDTWLHSMMANGYLMGDFDVEQPYTDSTLNMTFGSTTAGSTEAHNESYERACGPDTKEITVHPKRSAVMAPDEGSFIKQPDVLEKGENATESLKTAENTVTYDQRLKEDQSYIAPPVHEAVSKLKEGQDLLNDFVNPEDFALYKYASPEEQEQMQMNGLQSIEIQKEVFRNMLSEKTGGAIKVTADNLIPIEKRLSATTIADDVPVKDVVDLMEQSGSPHYFHAAMTVDGTIIFNKADGSALYHEAFHRVSQLYLSEKERDILYDDARKTWKYTSKMSDKQLEEFLAEKFREDVMSRETNLIKNEDNIAIRFLKSMWEFIKQYIFDIAPQVEGYEKLRDDIMNGQYRFIKADTKSIQEFKDRYPDEYVGFENKGTVYPHIPHRLAYDNVVKTLMDKVLTFEGGKKDQAVLDDRNLSTLSKEERGIVFEGVEKMIRENLQQEEKQYQKLLEKRPNSEVLQRGLAVRQDLLEEKGLKRLVADVLHDYSTMRGVKGQIEEYENSDDLGQMMQYYEGADKRDPWDRTSDRLMAVIGHLRTGIDKTTGFFKYEAIGVAKARLMNKLGGKFKTVEEMMGSIKEEANKFTNDPKGHPEGLFYKELYNRMEHDMYLQNAAFSTFSKQRVRFIDAKSTQDGQYMPVFSETQGAKRLLQRWNNSFEGLRRYDSLKKEEIAVKAAGLGHLYHPDRVIDMLRTHMIEGLSEVPVYEGTREMVKSENGEVQYGETYKTTRAPSEEDLASGRVKINSSTENSRGETVYTVQRAKTTRGVRQAKENNIPKTRNVPSFEEYCDDLQNLVGQLGGMNISKEDLKMMAEMAVQSKRYKIEWDYYNDPHTTELQRDLARISAFERLLRGENVGKFEFADGGTGTPLFSSKQALKEGSSLWDDAQTVLRYSNQPFHEKRVTWEMEDGNIFSFDRSDLMQYTCPAFNRIAEWTMNNGSESEETFVYNSEGDAIYLMREPCAFSDQLDTHINDAEYIDGFLNDPRMEGSDTLRNIHERIQKGKDSGVTMHEVLNIGNGWNRTSYGKATDQAICKVRHDLTLNDMSCLRQVSDKGKLIAIKGMNSFHDIYKTLEGDPLAIEKHLATGHGAAEYKAARHAHYARAKFVGEMLRKEGDIGKKDIQEWNDMSGRQQLETQAGRPLKEFGLVQGYHYAYEKETDNKGRVTGWKTVLKGKGYDLRFFDFLKDKIEFFGENTKINLKEGKSAIDDDVKRVMNDPVIHEKINEHLMDYIGKHITDLERMGMISTRGHSKGDRLIDIDDENLTFGNNNKGVESKDLLYDWVANHLQERGAFDDIQDPEKIQRIVDIAAEVRYSILAQLYNDLENNALFEGDPAFVGGYSGQTKRISGAFSPGKPFQNDFPKGDEDFNRTTFRRLNVHDAVIFHPEDHERMTNKRAAALIATGVPKEEAHERAAKETEGVLNVMSSDGQSLMSPSMARQMMKRLGLWDADKQTAFEKWKTGGNPEEFAKTNLSTVMKCVYWGREGVNMEFNDDAADNQSTLTGYGFHKTSYAPMFNIHPDHPLWEVMLWMEKNDVGVLAFNSATKSFGTDCLHLFDYEGKVVPDALKSGGEMCVTEHDWANLRWQLPFNPHGETIRKIGVQGMKILMTDASPEQGEKLDKLIGDISERIAGKISDAPEAKKAVKTLLTRGVKRGKNSTNLNTAMDIGMDMGKLRNNDAVNAIFKGLQKSTATNTPGFSSVQVSGVGRSDLKLFNEHGSSDMAVNRSCLDGLFPAGCSYEMAQTLFAKARRELGKIDVMSYRIPTQGCASIHHMDVVEMMPDMCGDIAYVPDGLYAIFGCDNDGDKLYNGAVSYKFKIGEGKNGAFKANNELKEKFEAHIKQPKIESEIGEGGIGAVEDEPTYDRISEAHKYAKNNWAVYDEEKDMFLTCSDKQAFLENTTYSKMDTGTDGMLNEYMQTCFDVLDSEHAATAMATTSSIDGPVSAVKKLINSLTSPEDKNGFFSVGWMPQIENRQNNLGCNEIIGPLALATSMKGIYDERRTHGATATHLSSKEFKKGTKEFNTGDLSVSNPDHLFNVDKGTISDDLMTATSLAVDGSKDPIILRANVNRETVNAFAFCLLEGHGKAAYALCSNPIVRDYGNVTGRLKFQDGGLGTRTVNSMAVDETMIRWAKIIDPKVRDEVTLTNFLIKEIQPMMENRDHPLAEPNYMDFDFLKKQCDTFNKVGNIDPSDFPNSKQYARNQIAIFMHFLKAQKEMGTLCDDLAINSLDKGTGTSLQDNYLTIKRLCKSGLIQRDADEPLDIAGYLTQFNDKENLKYYDVKTREYLSTWLQASQAGPLEFSQPFLNNFSRIEKEFVNNKTNSKTVYFRLQEAMSRSMWAVALHKAGCPMERLVADDYHDPEMSLRGRLNTLYNEDFFDRDNPVVRQWKEHQEFQRTPGKSNSLGIRIKDIKDKEMNETYMQAFRDMRTYAMEQGKGPEEMKRLDEFLNDYITYQYISSGGHIASHLIPAELIDTHPYIGKALDMIRNGGVTEEDMYTAAVRHLATMSKDDIAVRTYDIKISGKADHEKRIECGKTHYKVTSSFEYEDEMGKEGTVGFCLQPRSEGEDLPTHFICKTDHKRGQEIRVFKLGGLTGSPEDQTRIVEGWYYAVDEIGGANGPKGGYTAEISTDDITNTTEHAQQVRDELYQYHKPSLPSEWGREKPTRSRKIKNIYQKMKEGIEPVEGLDQSNIERTGSEMDAAPAEMAAEETQIPEEVQQTEDQFGEPLVSYRDRVNVSLGVDPESVDCYISRENFDSLIRTFGSSDKGKAEIKKNIAEIFEGYDSVGMDESFALSKANAQLLEKCIKPYGYEVHYDPTLGVANVEITKVREEPNIRTIKSSHKEEIFDRAESAMSMAAEGGILDKLVACFESAGDFAPALVAEHIEAKGWAKEELLKALTSENINSEAFDKVIEARYKDTENAVEDYREMSDEAKKQLLKNLFLCG